MSKTRVMRWSVFALGVCLLGVGLAGGGYRDTMQKAIRICLECIGIG